MVKYPVYSDEISDLENQLQDTQDEIEEKESLLSDIQDKINSISSSNYSVSQKIALINDEISALQEIIDEKDAEIESKLKEIDDKQTDLANKKVSLDEISSELYMESRYGVSHFFLSNSYWDDFVENLFVKKNLISFLLDEIEKVNSEFTNLADSKEALENEKEELDAEKAELDDSYKLLADEKAKLQNELQQQYSNQALVTRSINGLKTEMSDLQYQLLVVRQGGTNVNPSSVPSGGDYWGSLEGFKASAPSGYFGVFSIGAYTNRNGLSQWGAKARAENGQSYTEILNDYYPSADLGNFNTDNISVTVKFCDKDSSGNTVCDRCINERKVTYTFDEYLYRLGEMPESWNINALKAQAIAARTYALNDTNYGSNAVRGDECGQAIASEKTGAWKTAVDSTNGVVLKKSGSVFSSQYSALHGGWVNGVWDVKSGSGDWMSRAWDTLTTNGQFGTYYWFYKAWYRTGYTVGSAVSASSCYRKPWLSPEELADIVNAAQVLKSSGGDSRVVPIYDSCNTSGNPYSYSELRNLASKGAKSVSTVVTSSSNGSTQTVTFYTDAGVVSMSGAEFKTAFNLRAPGRLRIPQNGFVHINIEKK
jgi:peptidoglycan hydrolase-like amidase/predicted  nucleic acid-binding Zn-ribbon protein